MYETNTFLNRIFEEQKKCKSRVKKMCTVAD